MTSDRHISRCEEGRRVVRDFVGFAGWIFKVGRIDHAAIGKEAIAPSVPVSLLEFRIMIREKPRQHHQIAVDENNRVAFCLFDAKISGRRGTLVVLDDQPNVGKLSFPQPFNGAIIGSIIDDDDLVVPGVALIFQSDEALF